VEPDNGDEKPATKDADKADKARDDDKAKAAEDGEDKSDEPAEKPKVALAKPDNPNDEPEGERGGGFLKKLFGGGGGGSRGPPGGGGVAVYDISAQTVYMPDGTRLEAHSGIGEMADNPKYVHVKMRGPTPPHTYVLKMRETRFHGVEAIRMLPVNGS